MKLSGNLRLLSLIITIAVIGGIITALPTITLADNVTNVTINDVIAQADSIINGNVPNVTNGDEVLSSVNSIVKTGVLSSKTASLKNDKGVEYAVSIYEMPEKLLSTDSKTDTKSYVKEYAVVLDKNHMTLLGSGSGSKTDNKWDSSGGVYGTVSIYYDRNNSLYRITRSSGSWTNYDAPGTALRDRIAVISCADPNCYGQYIWQNVSGNYNITTGFTQYADSGAGMCGIGGTSSVTVYRVQSGESWYLDTVCDIAGSYVCPVNTR